jgi:hypothetical protein
MPETTEPEYTAQYTVILNNCTITNLTIEQTGKPVSNDPPPGTGGGNTNG